MGFVYVCVCVCVWVLTLDLRNGVTYEYEICTVNLCDDTLKDDGLIFKFG